MNDITEQRLESAKRRAVGQRNYRRARDRALRKLGNKFPEIYKEFLEEERLKDEQEGKVWSSISGRTTRWLVSESPNTSGGVSERLSDSPDEGDLE